MGKNATKNKWVIHILEKYRQRMEQFCVVDLSMPQELLLLSQIIEQIDFVL
jgi:hypothetical protein